MAGRTYRYMTEEPMFPFGFGLSYSSFSFSTPILSNNVIKKGGDVNVSVIVKNTGNVKSSNVVQMYLTAPSSQDLALPLFALKGFKRITLSPGESKTVEFKLNSDLLTSINNLGESVILPGSYIISIGESSSGNRSVQLGAAMAPKTNFQILD